MPWCLRFGDVSPLVQAVRGLFTAVCGMSFPIAVLPDWAERVALALPPTYVIADLRAVMLNGVGIGRVLGDLLVLGGMGLVLARAGGHRLPRTERTRAAAGGWRSTDGRASGRGAGGMGDRPQGAAGHARGIGSAR